MRVKTSDESLFNKPRACDSYIEKHFTVNYMGFFCDCIDLINVTLPR